MVLFSAWFTNTLHIERYWLYLNLCKNFNFYSVSSFKITKLLQEILIDAYIFIKKSQHI